MNRRELLKASAALPLATFSNAAFAETTWPERNITMIVPFPAGGQADLAARPVAHALEGILGKSVIVDNRAGGAGGAIGNAAAARAEPDGYTLLVALSSLAVLPGSRPAVRSSGGLRSLAIRADRARARRSDAAGSAGLGAVEDAAGFRR